MYYCESHKLNMCITQRMNVHNMSVSKHWYFSTVDLNQTDGTVTRPAIVTCKFIFATILQTDIFLIRVLASIITVPGGKLRPFSSTLWCGSGEWMRFKPYLDFYSIITISYTKFYSTQSSPVAWSQRNFQIKTHVSFPEFLTAGFRLAASPTGNESEGTLENLCLISLCIYLLLIQAFDTSNMVPPLLQYSNDTDI